MTTQVATWLASVLATVTLLLATALGADLWTALFRAAVVGLGSRVLAGLLAGPAIAVLLDALATSQAAENEPGAGSGAGGPR